MTDKWPQKTGDVAAFGLVTSMLWLSEKYPVLCYVIIIIIIIITIIIIIIIIITTTINLISHHTKFSSNRKDIIVEN